MLTYQDLGILPVINAWGTITAIGGSTMPAEVLDTMVEAGHHYVVMEELLKAAGKYIAERLGVEAAYITSGAFAGMILSAAACMAGSDPAYRAQLPDTQGMKDEIVVFRYMRSKYDHALRATGAKFIEIGIPKRMENWELERAITPKTAAIAYFVEHEYSDGLDLKTVLNIAHQRNVPVIVDAAAELPPVDNLWKFTNMGCDLTIFSGGKDIRGPQSTGLIVGRKDLIQSCAFHSCPNHAIGRGLKVGKEEIMGFISALDIYLGQDFEKEMSQWETQVGYIKNELSKIKGVTVRRVFPGESGIQPTCIPRAYIEWNPEVSVRNPLEIKEILLQGVPRIIVGTSSNALIINPQLLDGNQEVIVVDRIQKVLQGDRK